MSSEQGRLVLNHSTHVPGLIPVLERLLTTAEVRTVTPGVIGRAKGHAPHLRLKISVPIQGGFKLVARRGKTVQEVFVLTTLSEAELSQAIAAAIAC